MPLSPFHPQSSIAYTSAATYNTKKFPPMLDMQGVAWQALQGDGLSISKGCGQRHSAKTVSALVPVPGAIGIVAELVQQLN